MPLPKICLESTLRQYAEAFRQVFVLPQFQHFLTVLLGLALAPERRTLSACSAGWQGQLLSAPLAASLARLPGPPSNWPRPGSAASASYWRQRLLTSSATSSRSLAG